MDNNRLTWLFQRYYAQEATAEEIRELMALLDIEGNEALLSNLVKEKWETLQTADEQFSAETGAAMLQAVLGHAPQEAATPVLPLHQPAKRNWLKWTVAAAVLVTVAGTALLLVRNPSGQSKQAAATAVKIVPGGNKATLTLADGSSISLNDTQTGTIGQQGNVKVVKVNSGSLAYQSAKSTARVTGYNTLTTPKGGQYQVTLPDGTKVWLNALSSLRFPVAFDGPERRVMLTGEAYFEVASKAAQPFEVIIGRMQVKVLGTHFNINSYADEKATKATLLEGAILISTGKDSALLHPGQQAALDTASSHLTTEEVDTDAAIAWKNGLFQFNHNDVATILRQISRWYEVDVQYRGKVPDKQLTGKIERSAELADVLSMLEFAGVHCRLEGKTLVIQ